MTTANLRFSLQDCLVFPKNRRIKAINIGQSAVSLCARIAVLYALPLFSPMSLLALIHS